MEEVRLVLIYRSSIGCGEDQKVGLEETRQVVQGVGLMRGGVVICDVRECGKGPLKARMDWESPTGRSPSRLFKFK